MPRRRLPWSLIALACLACGARTALGVDEQGGAAPVTPSADGGRSPVAPGDAGPDTPPGIDASRPDVVVDDCPDAGATVIYGISEETELWTFDPRTATAKLVGKLACPSTSSPWSMAVSRAGVAYSIFQDGHLFRIDTRTAACTETSFVPDQRGFHTFGMGYVAHPGTGTETLYVTQSDHQGDSIGLGRIDTLTYALAFIAPYSSPIPGAELTGTADGRLFAFWVDRVAATGSYIAEIDPATAHVTGTDHLAVGGPREAFAFAFWGGDFYLFTGDTSGSRVTRYSTSDKKLVTVTQLSAAIVGAGVSTCAPH